MCVSTEISYRGRQYRLEHTHDPERPYLLHGPRGACYELWRCDPNPQMLFVINYRTLRVLDGWFYEKDGVLKEMA